MASSLQRSSLNAFIYSSVLSVGNQTLIYLFIYLYFWLCWVFLAARGLSLVEVRGATFCCGAQASHCGGFSCC